MARGVVRVARYAFGVACGGSLYPSHFISVKERLPHKRSVAGGSEFYINDKIFLIPAFVCARFDYLRLFAFISGLLTSSPKSCCVPDEAG